jgi:hypothetical protein
LQFMLAHGLNLQASVAKRGHADERSNFRHAYVERTRARLYCQRSLRGLFRQATIP